MACLVWVQRSLCFTIPDQAGFLQPFLHPYTTRGDGTTNEYPISKGMKIANQAIHKANFCQNRRVSLLKSSYAFIIAHSGMAILIVGVPWKYILDSIIPSASLRQDHLLSSPFE